MKRNWMKLILALGVLTALVTSAFAMPAGGVYGDGEAMHRTGRCSCGGFAVEQVAPTGYKTFVVRHKPCPGDYRYNCAEYRYEYFRTYVCGTCGSLLGPSELFYENHIEHLHN